VPQQFKYTQPVKCKNAVRTCPGRGRGWVSGAGGWGGAGGRSGTPSAVKGLWAATTAAPPLAWPPLSRACLSQSCPNTSLWALRTGPGEAKFVDWQRVRVQENASEIPAGSMPRTLDVILRGEQVERAKAGDKCIFTGTLIVIPDVRQISSPGERLELGRVDARNPTEGIAGLKSLGVRDLTYRLSFLASSAQPAESRFGYVNIRDDSEESIYSAFTPQATPARHRVQCSPMHPLACNPVPTCPALPPQEKNQIQRMREMPGIYSKLAQSIAPQVHAPHRAPLAPASTPGPSPAHPEPGLRPRRDRARCSRRAAPMHPACRPATLSPCTSRPGRSTATTRSSEASC